MRRANREKVLGADKPPDRHRHVEACEHTSFLWREDEQIRHAQAFKLLFDSKVRAIAGARQVLVLEVAN